MKSAVLSTLEHTRLDLLVAIQAIEREDVEEALKRLEAVSARLAAASEEIRA